MKGCLNCFYFTFGKDLIPRCKPFPDGIPIIFVSGEFLHDKVIKNQIGDYVWTEKPSQDNP